MKPNFMQPASFHRLRKITRSQPASLYRTLLQYYGVLTKEDYFPEIPSGALGGLGVTTLPSRYVKAPLTPRVIAAAPAEVWRYRSPTIRAHCPLGLTTAILAE